MNLNMTGYTLNSEIVQNSTLYLSEIVQNSALLFSEIVQSSDYPDTFLVMLRTIVTNLPLKPRHLHYVV